MFLIFWFEFLAFLVLASFLSMRERGDYAYMFFVIPILMPAFGYLLMKQFVFDLVDEVWDRGDHLVVKNRGLERKIRLDANQHARLKTQKAPPYLRQSCAQSTRGLNRNTGARR